MCGCLSCLRNPTIHWASSFTACVTCPTLCRSSGPHKQPDTRTPPHRPPFHHLVNWSCARNGVVRHNVGPLRVTLAHSSSSSAASHQVLSSGCQRARPYRTLLLWVETPKSAKQQGWRPTDQVQITVRAYPSTPLHFEGVKRYSRRKPRKAMLIELVSLVTYLYLMAPDPRSICRRSVE